MKKGYILALLVLSLAILSAQDTGESSAWEDDLFSDSKEDDDIFGSGDFIEEVTEDNAVTDMEEAFLVNDQVIIGGNYSFSLRSSLNWAEDDMLWDNLLSPTHENLLSAVSSSLYLDARPDAGFRFFTKAGISFPFTESENRSFDDIVDIREMFSDFQYGDILFFRAGKQVINWGVGYMFSPADIINITPIDPENPDEDREGPVSFKTQFPFLNNNLYLYVIADDVESITDIALAPKAEFLLDTTEIGIGAYYKDGVPPYGMLTLTTGMGDFQIFGEGVLSYGTEKRIISETDVTMENPSGLEAVQPEELYFSGTAGFSTSYNDDDGLFQLFLSAQYMFNGKGYADPDILKNPGIGLLLANQDIAVSDLMQPGRHYIGLNGSWRNILGSDINLSAGWIGNLSDMSGRINPGLSISFLDTFNISLSLPVTYGEVDDEYSKTGNSIGFSASVSMGGGSF